MMSFPLLPATELFRNAWGDLCFKTNFNMLDEVFLFPYALQLWNGIQIKKQKKQTNTRSISCPWKTKYTCVSMRSYMCHHEPTAMCRWYSRLYRMKCILRRDLLGWKRLGQPFCLFLQLLAFYSSGGLVVRVGQRGRIRGCCFFFVLFFAISLRQMNRFHSGLV